MNTQTEKWIVVGHLNDIARRGSRCIKGPRFNIALFRTADDQIYAIEDKCPHKQGPLSQGIVHDGAVTCPLHNWVINLRTGQVVGEDEGQVRTLPVKLENGLILLNMGISLVRAA
ncbi:MAG: nitrite reductase small subunit NirD [Rhodospirillales bacterium]|nr:nitrite reductase small subunit NirD [Rhodospirillales bacterium]